MRPFLAALLLFLLAACVGALRPEPADPLAPRFDPIAFFTGSTQGAGTLQKIMSGSGPLRVQGEGRAAADGVLVLDQLVEEAGSPPRRRTWRMWPTAPGRYSGSLTDAVGPVLGELRGNRLRLRFRMKGGLDVEQWLTLRPDGRTVANPDDRQQVRDPGRLGRRDHPQDRGAALRSQRASIAAGLDREPPPRSSRLAPAIDENACST